MSENVGAYSSVLYRSYREARGDGKALIATLVPVGHLWTWL